MHRQILALAAAAIITGSCSGERPPQPWVVEEMEIPLYHSSTVDPESGAMFHVEYCAAKLTRGADVLHVVYRPIDYPDRDPGFANGDKVILSGEDSASDFGVVDGDDYWITDLEIAKG